MCNEVHKDVDSVPQPHTTSGFGYKLFKRCGSILAPVAWAKVLYSTNPVKKGVNWNIEPSEDKGFCFFPERATALNAKTLWNVLVRPKFPVCLFEILFYGGCGSSWLEDKFVTGVSFRISVCHYFKAFKEVSS